MKWRTIRLAQLTGTLVTICASGCGPSIWIGYEGPPRLRDEVVVVRHLHRQNKTLLVHESPAPNVAINGCVFAFKAPPTAFAEPQVLVSKVDGRPVDYNVSEIHLLAGKHRIGVVLSGAVVGMGAFQRVEVECEFPFTQGQAYEPSAVIYDAEACNWCSTLPGRGFPGGGMVLHNYKLPDGKVVPEFYLAGYDGVGGPLTEAVAQVWFEQAHEGPGGAAAPAAREATSGGRQYQVQIGQSADAQSCLIACGDSKHASSPTETAAVQKAKACASKCNDPAGSSGQQMCRWACFTECLRNCGATE